MALKAERIVPLVRWLAVLGVIVGGVGGCHEPKNAQVEDVPFPPPELYQPFNDRTDVPAKTVIFPDYRLNINDVIEVIYHIRFDVDREQYKLKIEDIINITFPFQDNLDQTASVQPDGSIRLVLVGDVPALGKTADELETEAKKAYRRFVKDPQLTVTFKKSNIKIEELKKAITTAPRGQSRLMPVKPDGTIDLAYVGPVMAFGKTVEELRQDINKAYADMDFPEIDVTAQINSVAPKKVYVMGEVYGPGMVQTDAPMTLLQALASAGGITPRGEQTTVLLVRRKGMPVPQATVLNVLELLHPQVPKEGEAPLAQAYQRDIWLEDFDLVYVPRSGLAVFDDWVDQVFTRGVRSILPYSFSTGLTFGYEIRSAPVTVKSRVENNRGLNLQMGP